MQAAAPGGGGVRNCRTLGRPAHRRIGTATRRERWSGYPAPSRCPWCSFTAPTQGTSVTKMLLGATPPVFVIAAAAAVFWCSS
ncbi:unnamed protein product [Urochloa humidicola]